MTFVVVQRMIYSQFIFGDRLQLLSGEERDNPPPLVDRAAGSTQRTRDLNGGFIEKGQDVSFKHNPESTAC